MGLHIQIGELLQQKHFDTDVKKHKIVRPINSSLCSNLKKSLTFYLCIVNSQRTWVNYYDWVARKSMVSFSLYFKRYCVCTTILNAEVNKNCLNDFILQS